MLRLLPFLLALRSWAQSSYSTSSNTDTLPQTSLLWPADFSRYIWASSVVADNFLYIDGGEIYTDDYSNGVIFGSTLAIDLSASWTNTTMSAVAVDKPLQFPYARQPWIWSQSASQLNVMGGWAYGDNVAWYSAAGTYGNTTSVSQSLYEITIESGGPTQNATWASNISWFNGTTQPNSQSTGQITVTAGNLHVSSNSTAYGLGGAWVTDPSTDETAIGFTGMVVQDLASGHWQNISTTNSLYGASGLAAYGQAVYVPNYGTQGLLVFLGGYAPTQQAFTWSSDSQDSLQPLNRIYLYDIASQTFFDQPATGSIPGPRWGFCAAGAADANGNGFDIFVHGGFFADQGPVSYSSGYDNIWVLSLPSFQWNQISGSKQEMRALHTCEVIGNSQMAVIGGDNPMSAGYGDTKDPWGPNAFGIFDMETLNWTHSYDSTRGSYVRSTVLASMIKDNSYPTTGSSSLGTSIFGVDNSAPITSTTYSNATGLGNSDNGNGSVDDGSNNHTAVGVSLGVLSAVVLIASLYWRVGRPWLQRHRYERSSSLEEAGGKAELSADPAWSADKHGVVVTETQQPSQLEGDEPQRVEMDAQKRASELEASSLMRQASRKSQREIYEMQGSIVTEHHNRTGEA